MADNPYAPPKTRVQDVPDTLPDGDFLPEGRGVPAGRGWGWLAEAWAFMGQQRWTFVGLFVLLVVIQIVANFIPIIGPLGVTLVMPVLIGGLLLGCDEVRRGGSIEVGHLFAGFQRQVGRLIGLGALSLAFGVVSAIIMVAIVGVGMMPMLMGGAEPDPEQVMAMILPILLAVLVICALSIPLTMAIIYAIPLIVFANYDFGTALKTSFLACLKNILPFLVWSVLVIVLGFVAAIPFGLGWLLFGPTLMVSLYISYRDVFHEV